MPASVTFRRRARRPVGDRRGSGCTGHPVSHPGTTLGYRVEADGAALAFIPDHEPALGIDLESLTSDWISGFPVADGATVLLHDAQYTKGEYADRIGWGHCSGGARRLVRVDDRRRRRLLLFHHDPVHTDDDLDAHCEAQQRALGGGNGAPARARFAKGCRSRSSSALAVRPLRRWRVVEHEVGGVVIRVVRRRGFSQHSCPGRLS